MIVANASLNLYCFTTGIPTVITVIVISPVPLITIIIASTTTIIVYQKNQPQQASLLRQALLTWAYIEPWAYA